jgi:hypothetical protein
VAYNFQTGNNKIKLHKEYESVTQKVLLFIESMMKMLKNFNMCTFILLFQVWKLRAKENTDNNLELCYILIYLLVLHNIAIDGVVK